MVCGHRGGAPQRAPGLQRTPQYRIMYDADNSKCRANLNGLVRGVSKREATADWLLLRPALTTPDFPLKRKRLPVGRYSSAVWDKSPPAKRQRVEDTAEVFNPPDVIWGDGPELASAGVGNTYKGVYKEYTNGTTK